MSGRMRASSVAALLCFGAAPGVESALPPYTPELGDELWKKAEAQVEKMGKGTYEGNEGFVCGVGTWGDGPQCNQWDQGRSPCWPSAMSVSATWDVEVMELWSREMAQEFGGPGRGQLGPGINVVRFPWNGRSGEYMAGEDPYFGAQMVATMVRAMRTVKNPPLQVAKHFIPNTIEKERNSITEEVDERTLFEVYYPPFAAAVEAGVAGMMCSYNLVNCTTGRCSKKAVYACASSDVLNEHLKGIMGFKGIVISDWDATKCQDAHGAADSPGCSGGSYIDNDFAAKGGLDLEMPSCMSFSGGVKERAKEKATRMQWSYLLQNQASPAAAGRRLAEEPKANKHGGKTLKWRTAEKCLQVSWDGDDSTEEGMQVFLSDCVGDTRQRFSWSEDDKKIHWASNPDMCLGVKESELKEESKEDTEKPEDDAAAPNQLRVWQCSEDMKGQEFKVFEGNKGKISSLAFPKLCVTPDWSGVKLVECAEGDDQELESHHVRDSSTKPSPVTHIHHSNAPGAFILKDGEKCLQAGEEGGFPYNGLKLVFKKCSAATEQRWLWWSGNTTIRTASHPEMCVDITDGTYEEGTPLQIWECVEGNKNQVFQMFNGTGKLHTFMHDNVCVDASDDAAELKKCSAGQTLAGVSFAGVPGEEKKPKWTPFHPNKAPASFTKALEGVEEDEGEQADASVWTPPLPETPPPPVVPAGPEAAAAPAPSWHTGVYDWKEDNPFGKTDSTNADAAPSADELAAALEAHDDGPSLDESCPDAGGDNYKAKCKLSLADRIIAEASVVLKNKGGVLPLSKSANVVLVGSEACATDPIAQGGGSGWNGFSCNQVPKVNVQKGIKELSNGPDLPCPDDGDDNSEAEKADVILIVVVPEKAEEGRDRSTLQMHEKDTKLIQKYSKLGKKVVVTINAPGPMIISTWDSGVDAIVITWLPGQQNGKGIAMALYNETYGASGRLPFTFPKCVTAECSKADELKSAPLGEKIKNGEYVKFTEKALIGYRHYHAKGLEVSYPFGHGLFAYGSAEMAYTSLTAVDLGETIEVSSTLTHSGPASGKDVPQLYISFPDDVPGDAESKPKWVLKGFAKVNVMPDTPTKVTFRLTRRDLSYWDDSTGKSHWVCAQGTFTACVGADANTATQDADTSPSGSCTTFSNSCAGGDTKSSALPLDAVISKDAQIDLAAALPQSIASRTKVPLTGAVGVLALLAAALVVRRRRSGYGMLSDAMSPLAQTADDPENSDTNI